MQTSGDPDSPSVRRSDARLRLLLADDHPWVLEQLRCLLNHEFDVVGAVSGGVALIEAAKAVRPDAVVCDICMPDMDGITTGQVLLESGLTQAVILVTMHNDPELLLSFWKTGIRGLILKVDVGEELIDAVHRVHRGETYVSCGVRKWTLPPEYHRLEEPPCPE